MSTTDADLPALPELDEFLPTSGRWTTAIAIDCMQRYARAAIEADRARAAGEMEKDRADAERWRMLPRFLEEFQIEYVGLIRAVDAARTGSAPTTKEQGS